MSEKGESHGQPRATAPERIAGREGGGGRGRGPARVAEIGGMGEIGPWLG